MNRFTRLTTTAFFCIAIPAGAMGAEPFPAPSDQSTGCDSMNWPQVLIAGYQEVIDACQEVVLTKDGAKWARFDGEFKRMDHDGKLTFSIQDSNSRYVDDVSVIPGVDQVAYIGGRETDFKDLVRGQTLNLYLPEGASGFTTKVGVPVSTVAAIEPKESSDEPMTADSQLASTSTTLELVQFSLGSFALTPESKRALDSQAKMLKDNLASSVRVVGHTSASASEAFNQILSEQRAGAVRDYLVNIGRIEQSRVTTVGYGEMRPLEREANFLELNSSQARANMRVEISIASS